MFPATESQEAAWIFGTRKNRMLEFRKESSDWLPARRENACVDDEDIHTLLLHLRRHPPFSEEARR